MTQPKMLLLDEPSTGLAPVLVEQLLAALQALNADSGMTIVLVEQNVKAALTIAEHVVVLKSGRVILDEESASFRGDDMWKWF